MVRKKQSQHTRVAGQVRWVTLFRQTTLITDMRLNPVIQRIIKTEVAHLIGEGCTILLFGSRVDDSLRGGDIDLLIESPYIISNRVQFECKLAARLYIKLGGT